jgi:drug/metabolite transporter (DMT)-like permease
MKRQIIIYFIALMLIDTTCQLAFKLAALHSGEPTLDLAWLLRVIAEPWIYVVAIGYLCAFIAYMSILKKTAIGPAYAASHFEVVPVLIISLILFKERLTSIQAIGCIAVIAGVGLLALTERSEGA